MENSQVGVRYPAAIVGAVSLLSLAAVKLAAFATTRGVSLFGYETHFGCWVKDNYGVPCPICGMTRSVILTMQGNLREAFQMHIGAPLTIFGIVIFGAAMLYAALPENVNKVSASSKNFEKRIFIVTAVYLGIVMVISIIYWFFRLAGYFNSLPELQ